MFFRKLVLIFILILFTTFHLPAKAIAADQPTAIFHAFNQSFKDVENFVCVLADEGYSPAQISPAQKSNSGNEWWKRFRATAHVS
jgi:alpha-amylase